MNIRHLDGIRGLAILLILARHFSDGSSWERFFYLGWIGVDLFFVLSGFLITGILLDTKNERGYYRVFIIRRVLRIFPLYYGVLIVCLLLSGHLSILDWFREHQVYFWTYTQNYLIADKGFFTLPLGHFWSLAIEEQFYLVWPLVVWLCNNKKLLIVIALLIIGAILTRYFTNNPIFAAIATPARMDELLIGSGIAVLMKSSKPGLQKLSPWLFLFCSAVFTVFMVVEKAWMNRGFSMNYFGYTIVGLFFGSLLAYSFFNKWLRSALSLHVLVLFGKYSYGIYVFHAIIINVVRYYYPEYLQDHRLISVSLMFLLTLMLSYTSYHLIEKHFLKMKPSFSK